MMPSGSFYRHSSFVFASCCCHSIVFIQSSFHCHRASVVTLSSCYIIMPSSSYCIRLSIDVFFIHHSIVIISFNCNYAAVVMTSLHSCLRAFDSQHTVIQSSSRHGQHTLVVIPLSSSHCHIVVIIQLNPTITKSAGKL